LKERGWNRDLINWSQGMEGSGQECRGLQFEQGRTVGIYLNLTATNPPTKLGKPSSTGDEEKRIKTEETNSKKTSLPKTFNTTRDDLDRDR